MIGEAKNREREALPQRIRELDAQIAENEKFQHEFEVKLLLRDYQVESPRVRRPRTVTKKMMEQHRC